MKTRAIALTGAIALTAAMAAPAVAQDEMAGPEAFTPEDEIYVPIVSKGFQHQFWQAVSLGAEEKAAELNMEVNFDGPPTESDVTDPGGHARGRVPEEPGRGLLRRARQPGCAADAREAPG